MTIRKLAAAAALTCATISGLPTFAATWAIDPGHSSAAFKIDHLKFSDVHGLIPELTGTIEYDEAKPDKATFDITVPVKNIFTGNPKRDEHLLSPDFFNEKQFKTIRLKSTSVKKKGKDLEVKAELTMRDQTKPVTFTFKPGHTGKDPWGNQRTGGAVALNVKRTDYGVSYMSKPGEIGADVSLDISVEAIQK